MSDAELHENPSQALLSPGHTYASVTDKISTIVLSDGVRRGWMFGFALTFLLVMLLLWAIGRLFAVGIGIWGVNQPVGWGFAIINFVWWIGIGHAGTLISAILLLLRQKWRTSINRFAEAMTIFAVACAGMFPLLHLGRPDLFYWLLPYPNTMGTWPQFRSPLVWDVFAVATYATVSLLFWYVGMIPDLATLRDGAKRRFAKWSYGILSMGWRGSAVHWHRYELATLLLAGLATPLVVSVHSIVGLDFASGIIPGWHATIFPPYFVAGAIYSGFAMVATIAIPLRKFYGLEDFITIRHLDNMAKIMLATGLIVVYGYAMEMFMGWYSGDIFEAQVSKTRFFGPYSPEYLTLIACNVFFLQLFWFKKFRTNVVLLFLLCLVSNVGMWLERFIIVVTSLHRDFLPSSWGMYRPTFWDWATLVGSLGLFFFLLFLFIRFLPMIAISEMRELLFSKDGKGAATPDKTRGTEVERVPEGKKVWGLLAEFQSPEELEDATSRSYAEGYRIQEAYTPFPVHGLIKALGPRKWLLPKLVLIGGIIGGTLGFLLQYWASTTAYPINVAGKPLNSWPAFIPITFELTVLGAALTAVLGMLAMNRLPQPYHPLFHIDRFRRATRDRFFLCIHQRDPQFDREETARFLLSLEPNQVFEVHP